jgi:hypothetical protein
MLEYAMSKQSERRGRFLIQEIEEEEDFTPTRNHFSSEKLEKVEKPDKNNWMSNINLNAVGNGNNNHSKRPKHSSIIMDSKIIHTTRMDSNYYLETFSTLIYEESTQDWVDFELIWKGFSQQHVDVVEDDMEKIFHYIDTKIDDSDFFCINQLNTLQESENLLQKIRSDDKLINFDRVSGDKIKINSDMDLHPRIPEQKVDSNTNLHTLTSMEVTKCDQKLNCAENASTDPQKGDKKTKIKKNKNRSVILSNFCCPTFVSPPISPINTRSRNINEEQIKKTPNGHKLKFDFDPNLYEKKWCHTESEVFKKKNRLKIFRNSEFEEEIGIEVKLKIVKNSQFSIGPFTKEIKITPYNFTIGCSETLTIDNAIKENYINGASSFPDSFPKFNYDQGGDDERRCYVCKSKLI